MKAAPDFDPGNLVLTDTDDRDTDGVRRYYDPKAAATAVKVLPGRHYVTARSGEVIVTVLGSCVAACIRDPVAGIGGMNHFMYPESDTGSWGGTSAAERYGNYAMEVLINEILKRGARRERLEVKVFGGANVIRSSRRIGTDNAEFVKTYLAREGLSILSEDLGGTQARRINYYPKSGKAMRLFLAANVEDPIAREELRLRRSLRETRLGGDVELFE